MADVIDDLKVQIEASTQSADSKIDQMIQKLERLQSTLTGIHMTGGNQIAANVNQIVGSVQQLSGLGIKQSLESVESQINRSSKRIADELAKAFDIKDKSALNHLKDLSKEFANLMKTGNDGQDLDDNMAKFVSAIESGIQQTREFDDEMRRFYETVKAVSKIKVSPEDKASLDATEDWKYMDGLLRQKMSTKDGISLDSLMNGGGLGWIQQFPGIFTDEIDRRFNLDTVHGQFQALNEIIKQCREGLVVTDPNSITNDDIWNRVTQSIGGALADINRLKEETAKLTNSDMPQQAGFDVAGLEKVIKSVSRLGSESSKAGVENISHLSTSLVSLVRDLNSAGTLNFSTDNILALANSVSKLGQASVTDATRNLESLKTSLAQFVTGMNDIGNISFSMDTIASLVNSVSRLGGKNATQAVQNLPLISGNLRSFVEGLNSIGGVTFNFEGMNNLLSSIGRLGGAKSTQAVANLQPLKDQILQFVSGLNGLEALTFDTTGLGNLVNAITRLGGKAAGNAIPNIQALGGAIKELMATLSTAPAVSQNLIQMTQALANLVSNGGKVSAVSHSMIGGLNGFGNSAQSATKHSFSLASAIGKVYATYWMLFRAMGLFKKAIDISSDLTEVQNVVNVTFGDMANKVDELAEHSIEDFGMSELTVKKVAGRFQAMGMAMGIQDQAVQKSSDFLSKFDNAYGKSASSMADMSVELTKLTGDMASFYNVEQDAVAEDLESILTGQSRPLRTYGLDLSQTTIQEWAMRNGLEANVKTMSLAEKAMLRYQYVMANTTHVVGDFILTSNSWANQLRMLKENFRDLGKVIGGALIGAFKPFVSALNSVMHTVIAFAETVANALGAIFGWTFEIPAGDLANDMSDIADSAGDIESATGGAADNAKKMADNLQAFDKLNVINGPDSGSGGGSSGGTSGGVADGAQAQFTRTESMLDKYKSEIDNLYDLGEYIGQTLTNAMNNISWDSVYDGAKNFGSGLANFLNGLISPELFGSLGSTIAGCLNTALQGLNSFGQTFEWTEFGNSIATGINDFFATFNFELLAETLNTWVDGLEGILAGFLENLDWKSILNGLKTFLENLDTDTIVAIIGVGTLVSFGKKVAEAISGKAGIIKLTGLTLVVDSFSLDSINGTYNAKESILESLEAGLGTFLLTKDIKISSAISGIKLALDASIPAANWFTKKIFEIMIDDLGGDGSVVHEIELEPISITQAIKLYFAPRTEEDEETTENFRKLVATWLNEKGEEWQWTLTIANLAIDYVFDPQKYWDEISNILFGDGFAEFMQGEAQRNFSNAFDSDSFLGFGANMAAGILSGFMSSWGIGSGNITQAFSSVYQIFKEAVSGFQKTAGGLIQFISGVFSGDWGRAWEGIKGVFKGIWMMIPDDITKPIETTAAGLIKFLLGKFSGDWRLAWEGCKQIFKGIWDGVPDIVKNPINFVIGSINKMISGIETGVNSAIWALNKLSFDVPDWVPVYGGDHWGFDLNEVSLPRIPQLAKGGIVKNPLLTWVGEKEDEAVIPLSQNAQWISNVADTLQNKLMNASVKVNPNMLESQASIPNFAAVSDAVTVKMNTQMADFVSELRKQNALIEKSNAILERLEEKGIILDNNEFTNRYAKAATAYRRKTGGQLGIAY